MPLKEPKKYGMLQPFERMIIKYKDIFDVKEFYEGLKEWFMGREWEAYDGDLEQWETYYSERITEGNVKELFIRWRLSKVPPSSTYLKFHVDLDFHIVGLTDTEVIREGQKLKVHKGEVELMITPFLEPEYVVKFQKNIILRGLLELFTKRIYRKTLEDRKKELYQEIYILNNFIKQWFKMKRYLPYEENKNFFPSYAWPSHMKEE